MTVNALSFLDNIDDDKRSSRWMAMRMIPISLYLLSFGRFARRILVGIVLKRSTKLSLIQRIGFAVAMMGHLLRRYCNQVIGGETCFVLVTDGPYRHVRHPRYAAVFLYGLGDCLFFQDALVYLAMLFRVLMYPRRMLNEEHMLLEFFEHEYADYKRLVPHRLVPGVY